MVAGAGYFFVFDRLKDEEGNVTMLQRSFAGACGGVAEAIFAVTPVETVRACSLFCSRFAQVFLTFCLVFLMFLPIFWHSSRHA